MYEHIEKLITMFDGIVEFLPTIVYNETRSKGSQLFDNDQLQFKIAKLLHHVNKHFIPKTRFGYYDANEYIPAYRDEEEMQAINKVMNKDWEYLSQNYRDVPPTVMEIALPVIILRMIMITHKIEVNHKFILKVNDKEICPWDDFCEHYMMLILKI